MGNSFSTEPTTLVNTMIHTGLSRNCLGGNIVVNTEQEDGMLIPLDKDGKLLKPV